MSNFNDFLKFLKIFQQAAGIFAFLKANILMAVHQDPTPDLNPDTLQALSHLMLAQAQEVIAYKCIRGMHSCILMYLFIIYYL